MAIKAIALGERPRRSKLQLESHAGADRIGADAVAVGAGLIGTPAGHDFQE